MLINYAHRGASEYMPENTFSSFYMGLEMGANGIETDVRKTKDGVLVLFHDDNLSRVTDGDGEISDYTYEELLRLNVFNKQRDKADKIVAFEDFLKYFGWRDLTFAIELKQGGIAQETVEILNKYRMKEKTIITSFDFECIKDAKKYDSGYRVGYLVKYADENALNMLKSIGGEQLCVKAENITDKVLELLKRENISCRAWGVVNTDLMKKMADMGVGGGMTVNFPDKLTEYLKSLLQDGDKHAH